jgi:hypothetical protein
MRVRHAWLVPMVVVLFSPAATYADNHWGDISAAASASAGSALGGVKFAFTKTLDEAPPRVWNFVGDANVQWGAKSLTQWSGFAGIRFNIERQAYPRKVPFVQALVGWAGDHDNPKKTGAHGMFVTGVGCDFLTDRYDENRKVKEELLIAWRVQLDWIASLSGNVDPYGRLSFGVVLRFKECHTRLGKFICPLPLK